MVSPQKLNLFFDADDTLWPNAAHFESAIENWLGLMTHNGATPEQALAMFQELEHRGFRRGWYGSRRLEINMKAVARQLLARAKADPLADTIEKIVQSVRDPKVTVFAGVRDTLAELGENHRLFLVTMGEKSEQLAKLETSGLQPFFSAIHVLSDKTRNHYDALLRGHRLERRHTWMIGNSLTKDIRPARAAGLKTCHIANGLDFDFGLAKTDIRADLDIGNFQDLTRIIHDLAANGSSIAPDLTVIRH